MRETFTILAMGALAASCGGKSSDWTSRPIKTVSGTVGGVAFTIDVPDGMRQNTEADDVEFDFLEDDRVHTPDLVISAAGFAKTLDEYLKTEQSPTWLRKETRPDGYVVSYENQAYPGKDDWIVYTYREANGKVLTCQGRVTPWDGEGTAKDKVPLVEKMCLSLKAK